MWTGKLTGGSVDEVDFTKGPARRARNCGGGGLKKVLGIWRRRWAEGNEGKECRALAKETDLIVAVGGPDEISFDEETPFVCLPIGNLTPTEIIGRLYELGCDFNWERINTPEFVAHIPSYEWAHDTPGAWTSPLIRWPKIFHEWKWMYMNRACYIHLW